MVYKTCENAWRRLNSSLDCFATETVGVVVVDDAAGLHPGVDDDGPDEFKSAFSQRCGDLFGERSFCGDGSAVLNGVLACHGPDPGGEVLAGFGHGEKDAC